MHPILTYLNAMSNNEVSLIPDFLLRTNTFLKSMDCLIILKETLFNEMCRFKGSTFIYGNR